MLLIHENRVSPILISRFVLNLQQVHCALARQSEASFSLNVQFAMQTQSGNSLPRSLMAFAAPVHVSTENGEIDTGNMEWSLLERGEDDTGNCVVSEETGDPGNGMPGSRGHIWNGEGEQAE